MALTPLAVIAIAVTLDAVVGEPPTAYHPVAWFGRLVGVLDRNWPVNERTERVIGIVVAGVAPLGVAIVVGGLVSIGLSLNAYVGVLVATIVLYLTTSLRSLLTLTKAVVDESERDLTRARELLPGLVGRDPSTLGPEQIRSGAIESVSENLSDGFVAILLVFAILAPLSLPIAAAAAAWVKAINTLDSMLGYPSKPIGTGSARLDDVVMWIPARITAAAIVLATLDPRVVGDCRRYARIPPSPNAGWPMGAIAASLSVRLEKPDVYVLNPTGSSPSVEDGHRAIVIVGLAAGFVVILSGLLSLSVPLFWEQRGTILTVIDDGFSITAIASAVIVSNTTRISIVEPFFPEKSLESETAVTDGDSVSTENSLVDGDTASVGESVSTSDAGDAPTGTALDLSVNDRTGVCTS